MYELFFKSMILCLFVAAPLLIIAIVILVFILLLGSLGYKETQYRQDKQIPYIKVRFDKGKYGEYLIYKYLSYFEQTGARFLFNSYLPCENGKTTEVDVMMIHASGIYIFESKNYSGWIFGDSEQKMWTQSLSGRHGRSQKNKFYNPILQNKTHIKELRRIVGNDVPCYSIIVFSERCKLKKLNLHNSDVHVVKRENLRQLMENLRFANSASMSVETVEQIYRKLYPFTQVSEEVKADHVRNIKTAINGQAQQMPTTSSSGMPFAPDAQALIPPSQTVGSSGKICPRCGNELILRTAKKGKNMGEQFYGCKLYPNCKYIEKL